MTGLRAGRTTRCLATAVAMLAVLPAGPALAQRDPNPDPAPAPTRQPPVAAPTINPYTFADQAQEYRDRARMALYALQSNLLDRYEETREFAECAQRVTPSKVTNLLSQRPASSGERRAANSLMRFAPGCLGHNIVISTRFLRGAVAEAVLEHYRTEDPDLSTEVNSRRVENFVKATPEADEKADSNIGKLVQLTQCQVLFAPGLVRRVLEAKPNSKDEEDLRGELSEGSKACGTVEVKNSAEGLVFRTYLAEALYHWTRTSGNAANS